MTVIEGIGDEVTQFFIALFAILFVTIAWWTTSVREPRHIQSVYLVDYSYRLRFARDNHRSYLRVDSNSETSRNTTPVQRVTSSPADTELVTQVTNSENSAISETTSSGSELVTQSDSTVAASGESSSPGTSIVKTPEELEQADIVDAMDDDNELRKRRLAFFSGERSTNENDVAPETSTNIDGVSASDVTDSVNITRMEHNYAEVPTIAETTSSTNNTCQNSEEDIIVKLKYTNDELKIVTGRLDELLGDFKKRHFSEELSNNKLVRLIFNGKILQSDENTLRHCGIFNNCVVHCLVHQRRNTDEHTRANNNGGGRRMSSSFTGGLGGNNGGLPSHNHHGDGNQRDWDLGSIFSKCANFVLVAAWYFRYATPQFWTLTATLCLIALTGLSVVIYAGVYFPNSDNLNGNRRTTPQQERNTPTT